MAIRRLVFWQNMASHHQAGVMVELARSQGFEVVWVVDEHLSGNRAAMGWPELVADEVDLVVAPTEERARAIVFERVEESLHCVGGTTRWPATRLAMPHLLKSGVRLATMREAPVPPGMPEVDGANPLKKIPGLLGAMRRYERWKFGRQFTFGLCIGRRSLEAAVSWGYPADKLFPWCYFLASSETTFAEPVGNAKQILYLGVMTGTKGVDLILPALSLVDSGLNWEMTFVGEGALKDRCIEQARSYGFGDRVKFLGFMPSAEAMNVLAGMDLVVAPSRHDGWNSVVTESLMRGVPVVTSSMTGAASAVLGSWQGRVFESGTVAELSRAIDSVLREDRRLVADRAALSDWARCFESAAGAHYLAEIIRFIESGGRRPQAPWIDTPGPV
jgi:hypothetical protein